MKKQKILLIIISLFAFYNLKSQTNKIDTSNKFDILYHINLIRNSIPDRNEKILPFCIGIPSRTFTYYDSLYIDSLVFLLNDTSLCAFIIKLESNIDPFPHNFKYKYSTMQLEIAGLIYGIINNRYPFFESTINLIDKNKPGYIAMLDNDIKKLLIYKINSKRKK